MRRLPNAERMGTPLGPSIQMSETFGFAVAVVEGDKDFGAEVGDTVGDEVCDSAGGAASNRRRKNDSVADEADYFVGARVVDSVGIGAGDSFSPEVGDSVGDKVGDSSGAQYHCFCLRCGL